VSQAVAIFLWEIWKKQGVKPVNIPPRATRDDIDKITSLLGEITSIVVSSRDKVDRCSRVLRRVIYRSMLSNYEARVILYWARRTLRKLSGQSKC
jgi:tRNA C32,U32 (ribose-2'-O)-methylase TrmJ